MNRRPDSRTIAIIVGVIIVILAGIAVANPSLLGFTGSAGLKPKETDTPVPPAASTDTPVPPAAPTDTPVPPAAPTDTPVPPAAPTDTQAPAAPTNTQQSAAPTNTQQSAAEPTKTKKAAAPTNTQGAASQPTNTQSASQPTNTVAAATATSAWDKSSVSVSGKCSDDSAVFTVKNGGSAMTGAVAWRLYVDGALTQSGSLSLGAGASQSLTFTYPGQKVQLQVDQRPGHPGGGSPRADLTCGESQASKTPTKQATKTNTPPGPTDTPSGPTSTPTPKLKKITLCHATGSETNPYVEITISYNGLHGHEDHEGDIIPMPAGGCPKPTPNPTPKKITLCHATGSDKNPYVEITISYNGLHGHEDHEGDIIPMPAGGCPKPTPSTSTPQPKKITLCHATGSATNPYVEITISYNGLHGHEDHEGDIIPMPAEGCPKPPTGTPRPSNTPTSTKTPTVPPAPLSTSTPTPGPSLTPTPGPSPTNSPTPTNTATAAPTATPTPTLPPPPEDIDIQPAPAVPASCPQRLIFHTFRDQNLEIYRLDGVEGVSGAHLFNLSNSNAVDSRPSRSPNDQWVVFESNRNGNVELYYTDIEGQSQVRLTNTNANNINPMFGPDNETVIFQSDRNGNWDIFSVNINTGLERQLTTDSHDDVHPYWSPDPNWIVFESNRTGTPNLFLLNLSTGNEFQVTRDVVEDIFPAWSPNGKQLAFLSNVSGLWNLFVVDVTGKNVTQITHAGDAGNASWSPEGNRLAYQVENNGNVDVFTYDLRTNTEYHLTDYAGPDSAPTWDCGGTKIAFTSTRDGDPNLLQVHWQGGSQTNITVNPATDKWSEWSPSKETGSRGH